MKKRALTMFLALVLCMGLAVPAFASRTQPTGEETMRNITVSFEAGGKTFYPIKAGDFEIDRDNPYHVKKDMEFVLDNGSTTSLTKYVAIPSDTLFTVQHTGAADKNSFLQIYAKIYLNGGNGKYEPEWNSDMVLAENGFFYDTNIPLFYNPVSLKAGQSVQFHLPKTVHSDDYICTLEVRIYYPETKLFNSTNQYLYKIDEDAVKAYLADEGDDSSPSFTDVPAGEYFADPVKWAVENKITNGTSDTTFSPGQDCTQAQILTFLYRAARGADAAASAADMDKAVEWAREKGMIDASFDGSKPCTRATAVSYIWQAFGRPGATKSSFTDVPAGADYAGAVSWAVARGVTNGDGSDDVFSPDKVCNRGQIVTFLYRAYHN